MTVKKQQLIELLKIHFGYSTFRPGQEQAIDSLLSGQDAVAVLPTGGGKSMIYQLPALILDGITIVVSPLIALMKDQVDSLEKVGIPATFINSSISLAESTERLKKMRAGEYRLIYIAPERFYNQAFISDLKKVKVALFAIDEAHCISQWGHDFRPSYLRLGEAIKLVGSPLVVALTATATPEVREDIIKQLNLQNPQLIVSGFARKNLRFAATQAASGHKLDKILELFDGPDLGPGIIYVGTRAKADDIVELLNERNIKAVEYHAGLDNDSRNWVQEQFMTGQAQVVVATNAFGLGINKRDIRFVIHYDLPGTIEAYYQEAGRAGRDGQESFCLLVYSPTDRYLQEFFIQGDNPKPETVMDVYRYLLKINEERDYNDDSLLITYSEVVSYLEESVPEMAVGTALRILEKEGYISRPNERTVNTFLKAKMSWDDMLATVSPRAKSQRQVLEALAAKFYQEILAGWQISLDDLAVILRLSKDKLNRAIKSLAEKEIIEFRPPFRGTEIRIKKIVPVENLLIDLEYLQEKAARAYDKLNAMESYVYSLDCRQGYILNYFGEKNWQPCGLCDNCWRDKQGLKPKKSQEYLGNY